MSRRMENLRKNLSKRVGDPIGRIARQSISLVSPLEGCWQPRRPIVRVMCLAFALLPCVLSCSAVTVRTKSDMRLWDTVADRSVPLSWPWDDAADSATLVFSNRLSGAVSSVDVQRGGGETRGSCAPPSPPTDESLIDVMLLQTAGDDVIVRETATLAYVDGAGGGPITVRTKGAAAWRRVRVPRIFAFDPAWRGLDGDSGYDIALPCDLAIRIVIR